MFNEHGDPAYLNIETAPIDTANSLNLYTNDQNFSAPLFAHGVAVSHSVEKENNNLYSWGKGLS